MAESLRTGAGESHERPHESKEAGMSLCKGCGREIVFGKIYTSGKKVPLEICKHAYRELGGDSDDTVDALIVENIRDEVIYVSHFLVCKNADEFSSSKGELKESNPRDNIDIH